MYDISVPIIGISAEKMGLEKHLENLKRLDAKRVMIALDKYFISEKTRKNDINALKKCCEFYKSHGFEVGAWIWTFMIAEKNDFVHMTGINGEVSKTQICPSDDRFRKFACDYIAEVASCGVDLIQFDDDFRYGHYDFGLGCACENHMDFVRKELGEDITREELSKKVLYGGESKYRTAWQKSKAHYFELFSKDIRKAVDAVNPNIRISICSCMTVWDFDGIDTASISRILAGNTKPVARLIGAPYWAVNKGWGNRLQNVIELERMEASWCGDNIELMAEGDSYPRPRTNCPASYVEIYDTALRASGALDGILKYDIDYNSNPGYEQGYIIRHEKNRGLYKEIDKHFDDKTPCGIRIYERMQKFNDMVIPPEFEGSNRVEDFFFSPAAKMIADNSIPGTYDGEGVCGIAFAENVKAVSSEAMKKGLIIDLRASEILKEQGIDVGLLSIGKKYRATEEYFDFLDNQYAIDNDVCNINVNPNAKILSHFISYTASKEEENNTIGSYYYKNADGQQFLVFAFYAYAQLNLTDNYYRSYMRSAELKHAINLFGGEKLPAYSYGNPDLYIIAKKNSNSMSVGLWNIFADEIFEPVIELDREYSEIEFINCRGRLEGNKVILSDMAPFSFAGFEVK
mgnify:CR=1 FL=1